MGYGLYREVKKHAPQTLTHREKLVAMVLADESTDETRLTRTSAFDPMFLAMCMVKNDRDMRKILARLQEEKIIERASGGHNGRVAKFRFLHLGPAVGGSEGTGYEDDGAEPEDQKEPPTEGVGGSFQHRRRSKKNLPTPSVPSTTSPSAAPPAEPEPPTPPPPTQEEEGSSASQDINRARLLLSRLPAPWTLGPADSQALAPQLADAAAAQGWEIGDQLAAAICTNPGGMNNPAEILAKKRIPNLLPYTAVHGPRSSLPPACPACLARNPHAQFNPRWRTHNGQPCPNCHPDAAPAAA